MLKFAKIIASLGGIGFIKPLSATWGSALAGVLLYFTYPFLSLNEKVIFLSVVIILGIIISEYISKKTKEKDPHYIVIDELAGMMICTIFLDQIWSHFFIALIFFRIFDIAKIWPASMIDRRNGGLAIMADDLIMAIPALFCTNYFITAIL